MLSVVIIDDEEAAIFVLADILSELTTFEIRIAGTASNFEDGVKLIKRTQPDIVFLDISMPKKNGLEIFNVFKDPHFKIIFCTAYEKFAIDVIRKSGSNFLLKPVDFDNLQETLQKVSDEIQQEQQQLLLEDKICILSTPDISGKSIVLDVDNGFIMGNTRNIEYCYAKDSISVIVMYTQQEITVDKTLKELQKLLPENQFYQTHRSYLVNIYYIQKFVHAFENYVLLNSGAKIPVSVRVSSSIARDIKNKIHHIF